MIHDPKWFNAQTVQACWSFDDQTDLFQDQKAIKHVQVFCILMAVGK